MKRTQLYELLKIPSEVVMLLQDYEAKRLSELPQEICQKLLSRKTWDEGVKELNEFLQPDDDGIKVLWEHLNIVCQFTYPEYEKRGIPKAVFAATMGFCTRFLHEHKKNFGCYKYVWGWWFPRQMSLNEFRIGSLEFEFIDGEEREIAVHIPSDADLSPASVKKTLEDYRKFCEKYYKDWVNVKKTCDTWMLAPQLQDILGDFSNILAFQRLFVIDHEDHEALWYMDWIYPGYHSIDENLPENTSLQRNLKRYLLAGNKFGVAKGHIKEEF